MSLLQQQNNKEHTAGSAEPFVGLQLVLVQPPPAPTPWIIYTCQEYWDDLRSLASIAEKGSGVIPMLQQWAKSPAGMCSHCHARLAPDPQWLYMSQRRVDMASAGYARSIHVWATLFCARTPCQERARSLAAPPLPLNNKRPFDLYTDPHLAWIKSPSASSSSSSVEKPQ